MDALCDRALSPNSKKLIPIQVVSFRVFDQDQRPRMKARYPFLTNEQIGLKIKDLWKNMDKESRQQYKKTSLRLTPIKSPETKIKQRKRKCQSPDIKGNPKKVKLQVYESNSPSLCCRKSCTYKNMVSNEVYESDFDTADSNDLDQCRNKESVNTDSLFSNKMENLESNVPVLKSVSRTYLNSKKTARSLRKVPEVINSNSADNRQPGILRQGSAEKRTGGRGRVSFIGTTAVYSQSSYSTDCPPTSDDDSQALLLTRESVVRTSPPRELNAEEKLHASQSDDDSDCEGNALLIRRDADEYDFDTIDSHEMLVEDEYVSNFQSENQYTVKSVGEGGANHSLKPIEHFKSDEKDMDSKWAMPFQNQAAKEAEFKSPIVSSCKKKGGKRSKKPSSTVKTGNKKSSAPTSETSPLPTESVPNSTPQMDETLYQLTLLMVSKAPQKNRQSLECNVKDLERVAGAGRRVTRSLLATHDANRKNNIEQSEKCQGPIKIDMKGDAGCLDQSKITNAEKMMELGDNNTSAMKSTRGSGKKRKQAQANKNPPTISDEVLVSPLENISSAQSSDLDLYASPTSDGSVGSLEWGSPSNPALARALRNLRAQTVSPGITSTIQSSPNLLSPTLSGVSELSSEANSEPSSQSSGVLEMEIPCVTSMKVPRTEGVDKDFDLCGMLQDAKMNKAKQVFNIPKRMLRSCPEGLSEETFEDEEIF